MLLWFKDRKEETSQKWGGLHDTGLSRYSGIWRTWGLIPDSGLESPNMRGVGYKRIYISLEKRAKVLDQKRLGMPTDTRGEKWHSRVVKSWKAEDQQEFIHNQHEEERDSRWDSPKNTQSISRKKWKSLFSIFHISQSLCQLSINCLLPQTFQYMFYYKQQNPFKHFSFKVRTSLNFLTTGCWRDTARGRGSPCNSTKSQGSTLWLCHLVEHCPSHECRIQSLDNLAASSGDNIFAAVCTWKRESHSAYMVSRSSAYTCTGTPTTNPHSQLLISCHPACTPQGRLPVVY